MAKNKKYSKIKHGVSLLRIALPDILILLQSFVSNHNKESALILQ